MTIVEYEISSRTFTQALPFDEPFLIKGKIDKDKDITMILFNYRIKDDPKRLKWYYFPPKEKVIKESGNAGYLEEEIKWERTSESEEYFLLAIGPLHPNITYEFRFQIFRTFTMDQNRQNDLKKIMLSEFYSTFNEADAIFPKDIDTLKNRLDKILNAYLPNYSVAVNGKNEKISLDPFSPLFTQVSNKISKLNSTIKNETENINATKKRINEEFDKFLKSVLSVLNDLMANRIKLSPDTKVCFSCPLNPSVEGFTTYSINNLIWIIRDSCHNASFIRDIVNGDEKLSGKGLEPADHLDIASVRIITSFFSYLRNCSIKNIKGKPVFGETGELEILDNLVSQLETLKSEEESRTKTKEELVRIKDEFPNIVSAIILRSGYTIPINTEVDVEGKETPYLGIDGGIVLAPYQQAIYGYYGINFYLKPVNKRVPFRTFRGWDKFFKIFSIYFGFATELTDKKNPKYSYLIGSGTNLLTGCGFRINRLIRFNAGLLIYQKNDENPVINKRHAAVTPTISVSIDINIIKGFDKLGGLLKL